MTSHIPTRIVPLHNQYSPPPHLTPLTIRLFWSFSHCSYVGFVHASMLAHYNLESFAHHFIGKISTTPTFLTGVHSPYWPTTFGTLAPHPTVSTAPTLAIPIGCSRPSCVSTEGMLGGSVGWQTGSRGFPTSKSVTIPSLTHFTSSFPSSTHQHLRGALGTLDNPP